MSDSKPRSSVSTVTAKSEVSIGKTLVLKFLIASF
jgi:hypothetical protein